MLAVILGVEAIMSVHTKVMMIVSEVDNTKISKRKWLIEVVKRSRRDRSRNNHVEGTKVVLLRSVSIGNK